ncbi:MAG: DUF3810 family protein [Planctomycetes bacterium]|nr:DUF3810 family protein [Planctomycetota bacterium]
MLVAGGAGIFLIFRLLFLMPGVVETVYSSGLAPLLTRPLSLLIGLLPFSVGEVVVLVYVTWLLVSFARTVSEVRQKRRQVSNAAMSGGLRLARHAGMITILFYVLWGFNYARPPLAARLHWPEWSPPPIEDLSAAAADAVDAANRAYWDIHQSEDAGEPTPMPDDLSKLDKALEVGWSRTTRLLGLPAATGKRYGRTKRLLLTPLVARFGIAGFYFPWTGEANVLWHSPAIDRPQSMAHEKAHQRGTGPESEASFLGFLAAAQAPHAHARYAAYVFAQTQLLGILARADRGAARDIASRRYAGIRRDLEDRTAYWRKYRGLGTSIGRAVNNRFLRTNRVEGGTLSYARSVRLILAFARQNDGKVVPAGY